MAASSSVAPPADNSEMANVDKVLKEMLGTVVLSGKREKNGREYTPDYCTK